MRQDKFSDPQIVVENLGFCETARIHQFVRIGECDDPAVEAQVFSCRNG